MSIIRHTIADLPAPLRATAAAWARKLPATQRERQAIIRALPARGGLSLADARDACEMAAEWAREMRIRRPTRRIVAGLGYCPINPARRTDARLHALAALVGTAARDPIAWRYPISGIPGARAGRPPVLLPQGTPAGRLDTRRREAILTTYRRLYRTPEIGHGDESIILTADPAAVGVAQQQSLDWDMYSRRTRYPGQITDTTLTAPADWRRRVQAHGLAEVDGMMCLDAARLSGAPDGVDLWAATWIEQGRGYTVTARRGAIARQGLTSYHGDSPAAALAGLRRKLAAQKRAAEWAAVIDTASVDTLLARLSDADLERMQVRVSDARAEGACDYGIRSWCHATGLPYEAGAASLRAVWAAYQAQPRSEARAAILHALRRQRASLAA